MTFSVVLLPAPCQEGVRQPGVQLLTRYDILCCPPTYPVSGGCQTVRSSASHKVRHSLLSSYLPRVRRVSDSQEFSFSQGMTFSVVLLPAPCQEGVRQSGVQLLSTYGMTFSVVLLPAPCQEGVRQPGVQLLTKYDILCCPPTYPLSGECQTARSSASHKV